MKRIAIILILLSNIALYAKPIIIVSILPQLTFVKKITKDKVDVIVMVRPGNSPHSYEPKPSQMMSLSKADIYFSIGVEMEDVWLDRFKSQNNKLRFIDISKGISRIEILEHTHHESEHHEEENHEELDPHVWTSPTNVKLIAKNIYDALIEMDASNKTYYKMNLDIFLQEIADTDKQIKNILKDMKPKSKFMVFHPSWGYFAKEYNLRQIAVEVEGKNPKPKEIIAIIKELKEEKINVIFTQPEFSDKSAKVIANEANVRVEKLSVLHLDWSENLIHMAKIIADK